MDHAKDFDCIKGELFVMVCRLLLVLFLSMVLNINFVSANQIEEASLKCQAIKNRAEHDKCLMKMAQKYRYMGFCDDLMDKEFYSLCWKDVVLGIYNWEPKNAPFNYLCSSLNSEYARDMCFMEAAHRTMKKSYCEKVISSTNKEECLVFVDRAIREGSWHTGLWDKQTDRFIEKKDYNSAIILLTDLIKEAEFKNSPKHSTFYHYYQKRAKAYELTGENEKAIADWKACIQILEDGNSIYQSDIKEFERHIASLEKK